MCEKDLYSICSTVLAYNRFEVVQYLSDLFTSNLSWENMKIAYTTLFIADVQIFVVVTSSSLPG